jgi:lysophospholipase L1-like esterase
MDPTNGSGTNGDRSRDRVGLMAVARRSTVLAAGGAALALLTPATLAALRVRRMRSEARTRPMLVLDLELDGIEPRRTVVTLGDSSSAGFRLTDPEQSASRRVARALHLRDGRATRLRSVARNGATTADVLADQVEAVAGAEIVLVGVGANDAKDRVPVGEAEAALRALIVRIRDLAAPGVRIVLVGCPDLSVAPGLPRLVRLAMRPLVRRITRMQQRVADEEGVVVIPLPRDQLTSDVFADDGFHPGPLGHERVAGRVLAHL